MSSLSQRLKAMGACSEALEWAASQRNYQEAWDSCQRPDWMIWLIGRTLPAAVSVEIACKIAREVLCFIPENEKRPIQAIEAAERWVVDPSSENAYAAAYAARAADAAAYAARAADAAAYAARAADAAAYAARAAAYAAYAADAADRAAYAAAYAAARAAYAAAYAAYAADAAEQRKQCNIIRSIVKKHPTLPRSNGGSKK